MSVLLIKGSASVGVILALIVNGGETAETINVNIIVRREQRSDIE